uniref:Pecanex-like protein n=1 Tax=Heterorhabditis bacteriophora TaxID=37862 RepID=A0A1I7WSC5_HETBA
MLEKVVDYSGLSFSEPQELYLLVSIHPSKETNKLRINAGRFSEEWLEMCCEPTGSLALRMTLWQDLLKGLSSVFHGQISNYFLRVDVDERWTNGPSKWFYLRPRHHNNGDEDKVIYSIIKSNVYYPNENVKKDSLGEMKLFLSFSADHVLPINSYKYVYCVSV